MRRPSALSFPCPPGVAKGMLFMSFREYVQMREGFRVLDKAALPVLAQINPWPATSARRQKLVPKQVINPAGTMSGPAAPTLKPCAPGTFGR
jgi:hypothetical protein